MFEVVSLWDDPVPRSPAGHMAADEVAFRHARWPLLRVYRWSEPAVSFGYGQRISLVKTLAPVQPRVRRWTGGGVVFHGADLTLGLALPGEQRSSRVVYELLHSLFLPGLREIDGSARLAGNEELVGGPACFTAPAAADILGSAGKLCGGALRRTAEGVLYQGSIQRMRLPAPQELAISLAQRVEVFASTDGMEEEIGRVARERYERWTERR